MKRIIILSLLVVALLFVVGCTQEAVSDEDAAIEAELEGLLDEDLSAELEAETSSEEGQVIAGQAYKKSKRSSCYTKLKVANKQIKKLKSELDQCEQGCVPKTRDNCVPKTRDDCIRQEYAGGIYQCGEVDDGCGGTVNCDMQPYVGGVACPDEKICVNNNCVQS